MDFLKDSGIHTLSVLIPQSPRLYNITNNNGVGGNRVHWKKQTADFVASSFDRKRSRTLHVSDVGMSKELPCPYALHAFTRFLLLKWAYAVKIR